MTKRISILLALSFILVACGEKAQDSPEAKKDAPQSAEQKEETTAASDAPAGNEGSSTGKKYFEIESGMIEMKNSMLGGSQVLYFDHFGARQAIISNLKAMGQDVTTVQITKDGWAYTYDPAKKAGVKQKMPSQALNAPTHPDELTEKQKVEYNFKDLEDRTILGNMADGYSMMLNGTTVKAWTWKKLPLYMELSGTTGQTPVIIEATKLDTAADVPEEKFSIPADVKITEQAAPSGSVPAPGAAPAPPVGK